MAQTERHDAGPYDREIDGALARVWARGVTDDGCALAAVVAWYYRHRDTLAALDQWHARHREWYAATDPSVVRGRHVQRFDAAHYEMGAAWQRVVKALEAARPDAPGTEEGR